MFRTFVAGLVLATLALTGCDVPRVNKDDHLRREIVGKWVKESDNSYWYMTFLPDGTVQAYVTGKGRIFGAVGAFKSVAFGNINGTWSISDEVLTVRFEGMDNKIGEAFGRMLEATDKATGGHDSQGQFERTDPRNSPTGEEQ